MANTEVSNKASNSKRTIIIAIILVIVATITVFGIQYFQKMLEIQNKSDEIQQLMNDQKYIEAFNIASEYLVNNENDEIRNLLIESKKGEIQQLINDQNYTAAYNVASEYLVDNESESIKTLLIESKKGEIQKYINEKKFHEAYNVASEFLNERTNLEIESLFNESKEGILGEFKQKFKDVVSYNIGLSKEIDVFGFDILSKWSDGGMKRGGLVAYYSLGDVSDYDAKRKEYLSKNKEFIDYIQTLPFEDKRINEILIQYGNFGQTMNIANRLVEVFTTPDWFDYRDLVMDLDRQNQENDEYYNLVEAIESL